MADYKGIKGFKVQVLDSDPPSPIVGQVFYNSTTQILKGITAGTGAWASGGNLNTARKMLAGLGTQTAAIMASGDTTPPTSGRYTANVESYNGTSYTEVNNVNTGRRELPGIGTAAAGLIAGGYSGTEIANTETWNGTSWSEANDLNEGRANGGGFGTQTAGLYFGGDPADAATTVNTESWNGTSWTEVNNLNTIRADLGGGGDSVSSAIGFGGRSGDGVQVLTEAWNGTSWTEVADQANGGGFYFADSGGSGSALKIAGANDGNSPAHTNLTEEWTQALETVSFDID